jgi:hypothetical protein
VFFRQPDASAKASVKQTRKKQGDSTQQSFSLDSVFEKLTASVRTISQRIGRRTQPEDAGADAMDWREGTRAFAEARKITPGVPTDTDEKLAPFAGRPPEHWHRKLSSSAFSVRIER